MTVLIADDRVAEQDKSVDLDLDAVDAATMGRVGSWRGGNDLVLGPGALMPAVSHRVVPLRWPWARFEPSLVAKISSQALTFASCGGLAKPETHSAAA